MKEFRRKYNLNKAGAYVSIRNNGVFLYSGMYSKDALAKIDYSEVELDEERMDLILLDGEEKFIAIIYSAEMIWDMRD